MTSELKKILNREKPAKNIFFDELMDKFTSFRVGGPADAVIIPTSLYELKKTLTTIKDNNLPYEIIGGGTNLLISDKGIRGIAIITTALNEIIIKNSNLSAFSGAEVESVCERAQKSSLSGLEFIYGMPGTIGGAIWMNARCYSKEISETLKEVIYIDEALEIKQYIVNPNDFSYKISPFQNEKHFIIDATFNLTPGNSDHILHEMNKNKSDRKEKGHYDSPNAGSTFKNNRGFGSPTGKILDELGLRGFTHGKAQIAPYHGNIFINLGGAKADDILYLIKYAYQQALKKKNIKLDPEIRFVGEWSQEDLDLNLKLDQ